MAGFSLAHSPWYLVFSEVEVKQGASPEHARLSHLCQRAFYLLGQPSQGTAPGFISWALQEKTCLLCDFAGCLASGRKEQNGELVC